MPEFDHGLAQKNYEARIAADQQRWNEFKGRMEAVEVEEANLEHARSTAAIVQEHTIGSGAERLAHARRNFVGLGKIVNLFATRPDLLSADDRIRLREAELQIFQSAQANRTIGSLVLEEVD